MLIVVGVVVGNGFEELEFIDCHSNFIEGVKVSGCNFKSPIFEPYRSNSAAPVDDKRRTVPSEKGTTSRVATVETFSPSTATKLGTN